MKCKIAVALKEDHDQDRLPYLLVDTNMHNL